MANRKDLISSGVEGILGTPKRVNMLDDERESPVQPRGEVSPVEHKMNDAEQEPSVTSLRGRPRNHKKNFWTGRRVHNTSLRVDLDQYDKVMDLAYRNRCSTAEMLYRLIEAGMTKLNY